MTVARWCRAFVLISLTAALTAWGSEQVVEPTWTVSSYPNPSRDIDRCGRGVKSWICDPDHVMSKKGADILEGVIKTVAAGESPYATIPCGEDGPQGYEIGFAIMRRMEVPKGMADSHAAEMFALSLHDTWGVGRASCQNGVLILLALENRQMYISVGSGARSHLPDSELDKVIDHAARLLRRGKFNEALQGMAVNIGMALASKEIDEPTEDDWVGGVIVAVVVAGMGFLIWKGITSGRRERARYKDCRALLERIKKDQAALQSGAYSVTSCPICLEEFAVDTGTDTQGSEGGDEGTQAAASSTTDTETTPLLDKKDEAPSGTDGPGSDNSGAGPSSSAAGAAAAAAVGAAAEAAGAAAAAKNVIPPRKPLVVQCGHVFCEPCLDQWVAQQKKLSCPICRRDMDTGDAPPPPPPSTSNGSGGEGQSCSEQVEAWEQAFPDPVLPDARPNPTLRLNTQGWHRTRTGSWRYRGANGWSSSDLQRHYQGALTEEQLREMQRNELLFRILALRRRYPEFVTSDMARGWANDVSLGRELSAETVRQFVMNDPAVRRALEQQGRSGASSGFGGGGGGGRSSGGRGGSW